MKPLGADIQAVTFDIGGTLITPWPSVGHVYAEIAARHGHPGISPKLLERRFAAAWKAFPNFNHTREQWATLVEATFRGLVPLPPRQTFFPALYDRFTEPAAWHVFEDVLPALEALKARRMKLGVISNWDERLRPLLRALNLDAYFDVIVISCEAGCSKPSPGIFKRAIEALGMPAAAVLHVGDSLPLDVHGAAAAGMRGLLLERRAAGPRGRGSAIRSLAELRRGACRG